jgi:hypothetical protein
MTKKIYSPQNFSETLVTYVFSTEFTTSTSQSLLACAPKSVLLGGPHFRIPGVHVLFHIGYLPVQSDHFVPFSPKVAQGNS